MRGIKAYVISALILVVFSVGWRVSSPIDTAGLSSLINMSLLDTLLFVSDSGSGVHVYNVTDPAAPEYAMTIPLRGNRGTAARDDILFANDWGSLYVIRVEGQSYEVIKTIKRDEPYFDDMHMCDYERGWGCACFPTETLDFAPASSGSVGSSFATFAVIDSFLYYLDHNYIVSMDISAPETPVELARTPINWTVETLFPTGKYLFVGGARGMYIFDRSDPGVPVEIGRVEHFLACDPVVVSDTLAFVTLRGGNWCGGDRNVLLSVNIKDPAHPKIINERPMNTPYGLALNSPFLYVSTGYSGYELLSVLAPASPTVVKTWPEWATKDFIWYGDILYVMGFGDVKIYDVSMPDEPVLLSQIN